jgi:hypothetical protein
MEVMHPEREISVSEHPEIRKAKEEFWTYLVDIRVQAANLPKARYAVWH